MFDDAPYRRPVLVFAGAAVFALGFATLAVLAERVAGGAWVVTPAALALGGAAFVGYLVLALLVARVPPS